MRTTTRRTTITALALVLALAVVASGCRGTWGLRSSYRDYVTSPVGAGGITTDGGVSWQDGPTSGEGPFQWPVDWAEVDTVAEEGTVQLGGGVTTWAHPTPEGDVLHLEVWNPRLELDGDEGVLFADLVYRPYAGTSPAELPALEAALATPFATVDLSGFDWTPNAEGRLKIVDAPMTGVAETMELIGWDQFYGHPVTLDPLSITWEPAAHVPSLAATPTVTVSDTTDLVPGDAIIVWGEGFDPDAHVGTRPPLAGQPSGAYVVFGRFGDPWKPSAGAPSSSRTVIDQRWALPSASRAVLDPSGTNPAFADIDELGRFATTLVVGESPTTGDYGVFTYPGSGAVDADQEVAVPVTVSVPAVPLATP